MRPQANSTDRESRVCFFNRLKGTDKPFEELELP